MVCCIIRQIDDRVLYYWTDVEKMLSYWTIMKLGFLIKSFSPSSQLKASICPLVSFIKCPLVSFIKSSMVLIAHPYHGSHYCPLLVVAYITTREKTTNLTSDSLLTFGLKGTTQGGHFKPYPIYVLVVTSLC